MSVLVSCEQLGHYTAFVMRAVAWAPRAVATPRQLLRQLHDVLVGTLPLGLTAGLAMGVVIWLHLHRMLLRFGSGNELLLPRALALAVVLEFAPLAAGLLSAGRSGASLGAELGSLRLTEQIDALEVLGQSPWRQLIAPRVLACCLALPLLTILIAYLALLSSLGAELLGGSLSAAQYRAEMLVSLELRDVVPAVLKTMVFGCLVGVTGCYFGMTAHGGTEGVGRAATRSVVVSTFAVVISDVLLVRIIQLFG